MARAITARSTSRWRRRPDVRPRALRDSALKLLTRDGYRRIRLADVAVDAGVSKATVYHYFDNKDDLLTQAVAERIAEKHTAMERRLAAAGGSAADRLRLFLRWYWKFSLTPQAGLWHRLLVSEIVTEAPELFDAWARGLVQRWGVVEALIAEGQRTGEFRRGIEPEAAARMILSALSHQALFHVHFGLRRLAPYDVNRLFRSAIDQFLGGLGAPTRRPSSR